MFGYPGIKEQIIDLANGLAGLLPDYKFVSPYGYYL
jgi:hypothetical protein